MKNKYSFIDPPLRPMGFSQHGAAMGYGPDSGAGTALGSGQAEHGCSFPVGAFFPYVNPAGLLETFSDCYMAGVYHGRGSKQATGDSYGRLRDSVVRVLRY